MAEETGSLTTHVLDTARGRPAAGMTVELFRLDGADRQRVRTALTNADGRTDAPMLGRGETAAGLYELAFHAGAYLARLDPGCAPFFDVIAVRFRMDEAGARLHVPLLLSPFGYSTYRGS